MQVSKIPKRILEERVQTYSISTPMHDLLSISGPTNGITCHFDYVLEFGLDLF